ncbi:MAG: hypothetical protein ING66_06265 [Rhodocyclaceae bacterium]|nr:hypothetical protein [Rhodocyclaceae bacterium]MCA3081601.1 hypothetical protein [Rhodocyclaceae bacterium]
MRIALAVCLVAFVGQVGASDVTQLSAKKCAPGLRAQPHGGPFSVFVFCDDALGVNIAVLNASGGAGPGKLKLGETKLWDRWQVDDRVWQQSTWSRDITSFAWSRDSRSLYVATSGTYGTGFTYKLDLVSRKAVAIFPTPVEKLDPTNSVETNILRIDPVSGELIVALSRYDATRKGELTTEHRVK